MGSSVSASATLEASNGTPSAGESINILYKIRSEEQRANSFVLEIKLPRQNDNHTDSCYMEEILREKEGSFRFTCPRYECSLHVLLIYKPDGEDPKTLARTNLRILRQSQRVIDPSPVTRGGITLNPTSRPFYGYEQVVNFSREGGCRDGDYIAFYKNGAREQWEWCRNRNHCCVKISASCGQDEIEIRYFENGTFFSRGTSPVSVVYTLRNPMELFQVSSRRAEIGSTVQVNYQLCHLPPFCQIIMRYDGLRLFSKTLSLLSGEIEIDCPRLPGKCEICCVVSADRSDAIASETITVTDPAGHAASTALWFRAYERDHKVLCVRPNQAVEVMGAGQLLNTADQVVVIKVPESADSLLRTPSHIALQGAINSHSLGLQGMVLLQLQEAGVYHLCLGLQHNRVMLRGDWCTLIVSDRVGSSVHPLPMPAPVPILSSPSPLSPPLLPPPPPPPPPTAAAAVVPSGATAAPASCISAPAGFTCVICQDNLVCIKLAPCRHVCVCEGCAGELRTMGRRTCPICRAQVSDMEKVFIG